MNKLIALTASIAASTVIMTPVHAQSPKSVEVGYADLNLRTAEGVARFDRRIDRAIDTVCDYRGAISDRLFQHAARQCVSETQASITPIRDGIVEDHQRGRVEVLATLTIERPRYR